MLWIVLAVFILGVFLIPSGPASANGLTTWWPAGILFAIAFGLAILA